ncbi:uncharacterized protein L969DRAFT_50471 [Mixia osmundae IAM 14324]|uniref:Uncharacterized protein n=1 Tax=Mixia osmundae (strain CBS 9802 / IAM 14324 / JCM 22182 / KY 12970) TaxID=764103 RepID=G7E6W0_MIXOS|nr:uncharacterized protein L969DRAFT_50471 [Mixia osmundae IAM 14324]KEI39048.1 hypothetical protein L969DRAFT_50471 [Mixia osmundae IAM 14324]GAA98570.1 hypothetical protein E5Q_05257 [Mixia osmundae IAM 14324]
MFKSLVITIAALAALASAHGPARMSNAHDHKKRVAAGNHIFSMTVPTATGSHPFTFATTIEHNAVTSILHVTNLGHCGANLLDGAQVVDHTYSSVHIDTAAQPGTTYPVIDLTVSIYMNDTAALFNIASYSLDGKPMPTTPPQGYTMQLDGFPVQWTAPISP